MKEIETMDINKKMGQLATMTDEEVEKRFTELKMDFNDQK